MTRKLFPLVALVAVVGCRPAATKTAVHDTFTKVSGKADSAIATLLYGTKTPPQKTRGDYGWFRFAGNIGDTVDVWVRSHDGDAVGFILDSTDAVVAMNDDADATTTDSHVSATLPADGTYYLAFREYSFAPATFTIELNGSGVFTCKSDGDCIAVAQAGCCDNGYKAAVRSDRVEDYKVLYACADSMPVCSHLYVQDARVAECSNVTRKCEMVNPADIRCGGNLMNAHHCADGWHCQFSPPGGDIPGHCVQP